MPNLIAQELVGVQPMTGPMGQVFTTRFSNEYMLYKDYPKLEIIMNTVHTAARPFMRQGELEPNEHYRPWLEEHAGKQGEAWDWELDPNDMNTLHIRFSAEEPATLFELTWPK